MGIDSQMEAGFEGGSIKPPLESFLDDKLKSSKTEDRHLKPGEARYLTTLVLESGATPILAPEYSSELDQKYKQSREFLALMGPVGYPGETTSSNSDRTKVVGMAQTLMALTGNSEKTTPDGKISLVELQSLTIAKLMLSARELKLQGKETDPRLPNVLVTAIDNLQRGAFLKQGSSEIGPDHQFDPSNNLLNEIVPKNSPGGQAFANEFPARLKQRGGKPAALDVHSFWFVLCGGMDGNIIPQIEKPFGLKEKIQQQAAAHARTRPPSDPLAQHERRDPQRGLYGRVNSARQAERERRRRLGV